MASVRNIVGKRGILADSGAARNLVGSRGLWKESASISAALTGTITTAVETDIVTGGQTIILTLTNDTWVASGATFNAVRQDIIDGLDSAGAEAAGWNAEVRDKEVVGAVVRTSDTVVTITLSAAAAYDISAAETITATIPANALVTSPSAVIASPTFTIQPVVVGVVSGGPGGRRRRRRRPEYPRRVVIGGRTLVVNSPAELRALLLERQEALQEELAQAGEEAPRARASIRRQITVVERKIDDARADEEVLQAQIRAEREKRLAKLRAEDDEMLELYMSVSKSKEDRALETSAQKILMQRTVINVSVANEVMTITLDNGSDLVVDLGSGATLESRKRRMQ